MHFPCVSVMLSETGKLTLSSHSVNPAKDLDPLFPVLHRLSYPDLEYERHVCHKMS